MASNDSRWKRCAPSQNAAVTTVARAVTTKSPSFQWLAAVVAMSRRPAVEKRTHTRVGAPVPHLERVPARDDAVRVSVHHDAAANDGEDAGELVGDEHRGHSQAVVQGED